MTAALSGAGGTTASDVVRDDLEQILEAAEAEFAEIAGRRLLITGGAGFLGYYLVQAVARVERAVSDLRPDCRDRFDNYVRGVPAWLEAAAMRHRRAHGAPARHPAAACRTTSDDFEYIVHAAGIASPTYYRQHPIETMDANVNGLRQLLDCVVESTREAADQSRASSSSRAARSTATRPPEHIPTPETYRGQRLVHRPARLLRRVEALRRDAVRELRTPARRAGRGWRDRSTTTGRA